VPVLTELGCDESLENSLDTSLTPSLRVYFF